MAAPDDTVRDSFLHPGRFWTEAPCFLAALDPVDAELDREDSLSDRYAFLLGEQLGRCRQTGLEGWLSDEMERGYLHGRNLPATRTDKFLRKLLNVRRSAFDRGIPVSAALTVSYLQQISVPYCPVSGVSLTHGSLLETDWSVDRLDNTLGYVPGNMCVMATRVNKLKGTASVDDLRDEVRTLIQRDGPEALMAKLECGLLCMEARRLIALMAAPTGFALGMLGMSAPFAMAPGAWTCLDGVIGTLHIASVRSVAAQTRRKTFFKRMGKAEWKLSNRLVARVRAELVAGTHPCDVWFDPVNEQLLEEAISLLMEKPPELQGPNAEQKALDITTAMRPLARYSRIE